MTERHVIDASVWLQALVVNNRARTACASEARLCFGIAWGWRLQLSSDQADRHRALHGPLDLGTAARQSYTPTIERPRLSTHSTSILAVLAPSKTISRIRHRTRHPHRSTHTDLSLVLELGISHGSGAPDTVAVFLHVLTTS
jgi:hypothetical protein